MADNNGCENEGKVVWQSGSSVCVFVCWHRENNGSWVHKTEEGFSSAGTVLTLLSQSGLVAMCAVNLPLLCCRVGEKEGHTHTHVTDPEFIVLKNHLTESSGKKLEKFRQRQTLEVKTSYWKSRLYKNFPVLSSGFQTKPRVYWWGLTGCQLNRGI